MPKMKSREDLKNPKSMDMNKLKDFFENYNKSVMKKLEIKISEKVSLDSIIESISKMGELRDTTGSGMIAYQNDRLYDSAYQFCNESLMYFISTKGSLPDKNIKDILESCEKNAPIGIVTKAIYSYAKELKEKRKSSSSE